MLYNYPKVTNNDINGFRMKKKCSKSTCKVSNTIQLIGNKWVLNILFRLLDGTKRFGELKKSIEEISPKMLTQQLRKMEGDGLVKRKIYPEIPPRVEYSLSEKGKALQPVIEKIVEWGNEYSV